MTPVSKKLTFRTTCAKCQSCEVTFTSKICTLFTLTGIRTTTIKTLYCSECQTETDFDGLEDKILNLDNVHLYSCNLLFQCISLWYRGCSLHAFYVAYIDRLMFDPVISKTDMMRARNLENQFNQAVYMLVRILDLWEKDTKECKCPNNWTVFENKRLFNPNRLVIDGIEVGFSDEQNAGFTTPWSFEQGTNFFLTLRQLLSSIKFNCCIN